MEERRRGAAPAGRRPLGGLDPARVPTTLRDVIASRIDALPDSAKSLLQSASVVCRPFERTPLLREAPLETAEAPLPALGGLREALESVLADALEQGHAVEVSPGGGRLQQRIVRQRLQPALALLAADQFQRHRRLGGEGRGEVEEHFIAEGERRWVDVLKEFYGPFEEALGAGGHHVIVNPARPAEEEGTGSDEEPKG